MKANRVYCQHAAWSAQQLHRCSHDQAQQPVFPLCRCFLPNIPCSELQHPRTDECEHTAALHHFDLSLLAYTEPDTRTRCCSRPYQTQLLKPRWAISDWDDTAASRTLCASNASDLEVSVAVPAPSGHLARLMDRSQRRTLQGSMMKSSPTKYSIMFEHKPSSSPSSSSPPKILRCSARSLSRSSLCRLSLVCHAMYRLCQCRAERSFRLGLPLVGLVAENCFASESIVVGPGSGNSKVVDWKNEAWIL